MVKATTIIEEHYFCSHCGKLIDECDICRKEFNYSETVCCHITQFETTHRCEKCYRKIKNG